MIKSRENKILFAYEFLLKKERESKSFTVKDICKVTGWKESTVKTYINKQWSELVSKGDKANRYHCKGLSKLSQNDFIKINSQKIKFSPWKKDDRNDLLVKARQFSLLAIQTYNSPYTEFRTYGYIVNIVIAWTSLFHAIFEKRKIDYFSKDSRKKTIIVDGAPKTWELAMCINKFWENDNPIKSNLKFLIKLRNRIEHRDIPYIDIKVAGHCQSSLNNFEDILIQEFGYQHALMSNISLALQRSKTNDLDLALKKVQKEVLELNTFMDDFEDQIPNHHLESPEYRASYFLTPKLSNHKTSKDIPLEWVKEGSDEQQEINRILIKEKEKEKFKPGQIVKMMKDEGYENFTMNVHTDLWKRKKAKQTNKYGVQLSDGQWYWYSGWVDVVRDYCKKNKL